MSQRKIIVIAGPTAAGKTEYAVRTAEELGGEIVSCDSMQLYRYMDIGSASPTKEELARVPHHLVSVLDPKDPCSAARYQEMAKQAIDDIFERGRIPIVAGGTGLYLDALLYDMDFAVVKGDPAFRKEMKELAEREGKEVLYSRLQEADPKAAERIHPNNVKRVIRALEAAELGSGIEDIGRAGRQKTKDYDAVLIGLSRDRAELYERINSRVEKMKESGLVDEVKTLLSMGLTEDDISMKGIGYKEIIEYIEGKTDLETALDNVAKNSRHYAKRQMTWFRRYEDMKWFDLSSYDSSDKALEDILDWIRRKI